MDVIARSQERIDRMSLPRPGDFIVGTAEDSNILTVVASNFYAQYWYEVLALRHSGLVEISMSQFDFYCSYAVLRS